MKHILIVLIITGLSLGTVSESTTDDGGYAISNRESTGEALDDLSGDIQHEFHGAVDCSTLENPEMPPPTREYVPVVQRMLEETRLEPASQLSPPSDWNDDILVWGGRVGSGQDFDIDENTGDVYVCFDTDYATNDTLYVYRSTDGGINWSLFGYGTNSGGEIYNPKIRIVQNGSGDSQVVILGIWDGGAYSNDLYTGWWATSGGGGAPSAWQLIDSGVEWADLDADDGSGGNAYACYVPLGTTDINTATNDVSGAGWVVTTAFVGLCQITPYPAIAAGDGGVVGVVYVDDRISDMEIRVKMSTDYGATWSASTEVSLLSYTPEYPDIAFNRSTPATGWIICQSVGGTYDWLGYYYTTDSGVNWTFGGAFDPGDDENLPSIRARKTYGDVTVAFHGYPGYDTYFTWTLENNPTNFITPEAIGDFQGTGFWPPCAGWVGNYSAVMYTNWNINYRLMYDWYGNTGIEDETAFISSISNFPNPFSASTNISFTLTQNSPVNISVYNVAGQLVSNLADNQIFNEGSHSLQWDAQSFSPGVYFVRLNANGISQTHRMLMIK